MGYTAVVWAQFCQNPTASRRKALSRTIGAEDMNMAAIFFKVVCFLCLVVLSLCKETMTVEGRIVLGKMDPSNIRLSLNGVKHYAITAGDGTFRFYDIPNGTFLPNPSYL